MSWHFSRELVAGCMAANCLDGVAAVQWKLTPMPDMCSSHVRMMELFPFSRFGMMCVHLTVELGEALLTWFLAGFRARMCLSQDRVEGLSTASAAVCGGSMPESLPRCGRGMSLPKTARCWFVGDCISCCETLPGSGMMLRGVCYRHEIAELHTCGKECEWRAGACYPPPQLFTINILRRLQRMGGGVCCRRGICGRIGRGIRGAILRSKWLRKRWSCTGWKPLGSSTPHLSNG